MGFAEDLSALVELACVNDPSEGRRPSRACAERVADLMRSQGMEPRIVEVEGYYTVEHVQGEKPSILMMAHFDVVPGGPGWRVTEPFKPAIVGGRLYGRGSADDLSNVVAIAYAFKEISKIAERAGTGLMIAFTGDEEIGGSRGAGELRRRLQASGSMPRYVVNGDGNGLVVINRRRSAFSLEIRVRSMRRRVRGRREALRTQLRSQSYHAAYFLPGVDSHPLLELSRLVSESGLWISELGGSFVKSNVLPQAVEAVVVVPGDGEEHVVDEALTGLVKALTPLTRPLIRPWFPSFYGLTATPNVYSRSGEDHVIVVDLRAPLGDSGELEKAYSQIFEEHLPNATWALRGGGGYLNTPRGSRMVQEGLRVLASLGLEGSVVERAGASDSRYFSPLGIECIDFGPVGGNVHGPDEYVELWSVEKASKFYSGLVGELLSKA